MKKIITILLSLILCLSVFSSTGCAGKEKYIGVEGVVIDKEYREEHTKTTYIIIGKVIYPTTKRTPSAWYITVEYKIESKPEKYTYTVTEEEYNSYKIGDIFIYYEVDNEN